MGWPKGKSRGHKCNVCGKYFQPNGLGPHMTSHKRAAHHRKPRQKAEFDSEMVKLMEKAAALHREADQIEASVTAVLRLRKAYA